MGDAVLMKRGELLHRRLRFRRALSGVFFVLILVSVVLAIVGLVVLLVQISLQGLPWLTTNLIFNYPSRHPEEAGLRSALMGTVWLMGLTAGFTVPVGVGAAIYLEEYASKNRLTTLIEVNISNLAGVPSIVYGLLGLALFVQWLSLGRSLLAGALTMALLILPQSDQMAQGASLRGASIHAARKATSRIGDPLSE